MDRHVVLGMETNGIFSSMVTAASANRLAIAAQLDALREENLKRDFEAFVKAGKKLPIFVPRDPDAGLRYSTTTESALSCTAARFGESEDRNVLRKQAADRKMKNWTPQYELGTDVIEYVTDARPGGAGKFSGITSPVQKKAAKDAYDDARSRCRVTMDSNSKTQWELGKHKNSIKDAVQTSILPDPTGADFHTYRGILDPALEKELRSSKAFDGTVDPSIKSDYQSNTMLGTKYGGSQTDYSAVKARARELKQDLQVREHTHTKHTKH